MEGRVPDNLRFLSSAFLSAVEVCLLRSIESFAGDDKIVDQSRGKNRFLISNWLAIAYIYRFNRASA